MIKMSEYASRRKKLMELVGPDSVVILVSAPLTQRNSDADYIFRQNSDFYYMTGFDEPEAVAVIAPKRKEGQFILFSQERIREEEIWTGLRAGQEGARKIYGADQAFSIAELEERLPSMLTGRKELHCSLGNDKNADDVVLNALNQVRRYIRNGLQSPVQLVDVSDSIHEMRLIKSPAEIDLMRKAAEISSQAHIRAMKFCKPGKNEFELEAEIMHEFQRNGARFAAYTSIVGAQENSCILHYIANNQKIKNGDIVLIDAGCEYQYYASDITRTFPANGKYSPEQRAIYELVLKAQLAGIKAVRPGALWTAPQTAIVKVITEGLVNLGILKGKVSKLIEEEAYRPFYMHKSGHWLGLDVHDVGRYKVNGKWRTFQPGMVLTVEPGIYISPLDDSILKKVHKKWHNIGIRIEDDVLVTKTGNDVLSHVVPKTISEIESLMAEKVAYVER